MSFGYKPKKETKPMMGKPPAGRYVVKLVGSEERPSQSVMQDGSPKCTRVSLEFKIQGQLNPDYRDKTIYIGLNRDHKESLKSNEIFEERMDALCYALNRPNGFDTIQQIKDVPVLLDVYIRKDKQSGKESYEVGGIQRHVTAAQAHVPTAAQHPTHQQVPPTAPAHVPPAQPTWTAPNQDQIAF